MVKYELPSYKPVNIFSSVHKKVSTGVDKASGFAWYQRKNQEGDDILELFYLKNLKYAAAFFVLFISLSTSGCMKAESKEYEVNADPPPVDITEPVPMDFEMDMDYSNITISTESQVYSKDTEEIVYTLTNGTPGKGFYYFSIPYVEYYENGEWVRLAYYPPDYNQEEGRWYICGIEGDKEIAYSCNGVFFPQSISGEISDGLYRLVVFVGDNVVYAEVELKD